MPGYNSQRRGTARASQISFNFFFIVMDLPNLFIVMYVRFSVFCVLFVCKCVLYYCHRVSTQLQLGIYIYMYIYIYHTIILNVQNDSFLASDITCTSTTVPVLYLLITYVIFGILHTGLLPCNFKFMNRNSALM
jgi:uncharacterized membrane protein